MMAIAFISKRNAKKVFDYTIEHLPNAVLIYKGEYRDLKCRDTVYVAIEGSQLLLSELRRRFKTRVIKFHWMLTEQGRIKHEQW